MRETVTSARRTMGWMTGMATIWLATLLAVTGCGPEVPPAPPVDVTTAERQAQAFIEAIKPQREGRPTIAIVASNEGTEITDLLLTHAVLQRADIADVIAVAPRSGRVDLYPAPLQVEVTQSFAGFDEAHPNGADYVIVPAMTNNDAPEIIAWLKRQSNLGARIVGVCAGALVVANAGLLDDRRFTTHWWYRNELMENHPEAKYVPHRRYVIDDNIATTTGISASVPTMLALVEAIGGQDKAQALATELGVDSWTPVHDSSQFGLNFSRGFNFILNKLAFWRGDDLLIPVDDGADDVALAFTADAWSRTGHINVSTSAPRPVRLRSGMTLLPNPTATNAWVLPLTAGLNPMQQLHRTLCEIGSRFGDASKDWVRIELEYGVQPDCGGT